MLRVLGAKLLRLVPVLFLVSLGTFLVLELVPGDPVIAVLGPDATPESYERVQTELGLDRPIFERYADWMGDVTTGDFGRSLVNPQDRVSDLIRQSLPLTLQLALMSLIMALVISIPLGVWSAYRAGKRVDQIVSGMTSALISVPSFLAALILIFFFVFTSQVPRYGFLVFGLVAAGGVASVAVRRIRERDSALAVRWGAAAVVVLAVVVGIVISWPSFPRIGFVRLTSEEGLRENLRSLFLPSLTLALTEVAVFARLLRGDMIATLEEDYILASKAKGMPPGHVLVRDALRPSSFSLITLAGVSLGRLIGGTVIVESIFGIQGMGRLVAGNITTKDFTIVQGGVLVIATFYVLINALVDSSYSYLDPRVRRGRQ